MGIFNVDWLSFTADFEDYHAFEDSSRQVPQNKALGALFALLDEQREKQENDIGYVDLGLFNFEVYPHGDKSYYYILHNEDMQIKLARFRSRKEVNFPVYVHFKSQFLWVDMFSASRIMDKFLLIIEWLQDVLGGRYIASKINRIDLCYHTDDTPLGFNAEYFVGRHTLDTTRRTHRRVSGVDIGSRKSEKLFLRCYDKYIECRASKKVWFFEIWAKAGLQITKVWNIEYQMRREFFQDIAFNNVHLDSAEDVLKNMNAVWSYLTNDWVTYRIPDDPRRSRWSIDPWWLQLSEFHESDMVISRGKQSELPTADAIIPGLRGYMASYAARKGGDINDGSIFQMLYHDIQEYDTSKQRDFTELVELKRNLLDPEQDVKKEPFADGSRVDPHE